MNTPDTTKPGSVRLPGSYWVKLRQIMQNRGRAWLEKAIDREHNKLGEKK